MRTRVFHCLHTVTILIVCIAVSLLVASCGNVTTESGTKESSVADRNNTPAEKEEVDSVLQESNESNEQDISKSATAEVFSDDSTVSEENHNSEGSTISSEENLSSTEMEEELEEVISGLEESIEENDQKTSELKVQGGIGEALHFRDGTQTVEVRGLKFELPSAWEYIIKDDEKRPLITAFPFGTDSNDPFITIIAVVIDGGTYEENVSILEGQEQASS